MTRGEDLLRLVVAAHAMTRIAATQTNDEAPSAQWRTLKLLRENGPQRVGDLAALSRVTQPGMTRLVGQLAQSGLVERTADEADARVSVVAITAAGGDALDGWLARLQDVLETQFAGIDEQEWHVVAAAADILTAATRVAEPTR